MKKYKCNYCKDKGIVQIAPDVRGIKKCPYCNNEKTQQSDKITNDTKSPLMSSDDSEATSIYGHVKKGTTV